MKTKGITVWEQHAEKIVLGIAAVTFVALAGRQFIGQPNAVKMPSGKAVAPADVDDLLQTEAERILSRLDEAAPSEIRLPDPVPALDQLLGQLDRPVYPRPTLDIRDVAIMPDVEGIGPQGAIEFPVPQLKPPYEVTAVSYSDALASGVVEQHAELQEFFSDPGQPQDITFTTVFARFDVADLRSQFAGEHADLEAEGKVAIPSSWYHDRPENIVDVVIRRQQLVNGEWMSATTLEQIPGRSSLRSRLGDEIDASLRDQILTELSDPAVQLDIIQPEFYLTKNDEWSIPLPEAERAGPSSGEPDDRVRQLEGRRQILLQERERRLNRLQELGGNFEGGGDEPPDDESPPGQPRERRGGGRRAPGPGPGGMGVDSGGLGKRDKSGSSGSGGEKNRRAVDNLKKRITQLDRQIADVEKDLQDLRGTAGLDDQAPSESDSGPTADDEIWVWGHDLFVEPGKTYRYAVTLEVYNPFFGRKRNLVDEQQKLAESFTLDSGTSEWSDAIQVSPPLRVFITNATPAGQGAAGPLGLGRATAEVYRFYDGVHWMETFAVEPGGYIGEAKERRVDGQEEPVVIDFRTSLFVLDIVEDIDAGRGRFPEAGRAAKVLLQDLRTGEILDLRDPFAEINDRDRVRLRQKVRSGGA
ncbi:MAG: hypothetical protein ACYS0G_14885 [Planctomycetota bacterium]|jgi:hypothetical protein